MKINWLAKFVRFVIMTDPRLEGGKHRGRRVTRERKVLITERVQHVNRIKGLLFAQGVTAYEPLRRDRRERLEELLTGDGRALPKHIKAQVSRELDRLELLLEQIKAVEAQRDVLLNEEQDAATPASVEMLLNVKGIGPEFGSDAYSMTLPGVTSRRSTGLRAGRSSQGQPQSVAWPSPGKL